jgi:hypothetical protein
MANDVSLCDTSRAAVAHRDPDVAPDADRCARRDIGVSRGLAPAIADPRDGLFGAGDDDRGNRRYDRGAKRR